MIAILIVIYLVSFVIHLIMCYRENRYHIFYVKDLLAEIDVHMWFPFLNTITLIAIVVGIVIITLWKLFKLDVLWEKFINIKLK